MAATPKPEFRLNGCTNIVDEPYQFLDQAHGVLACLDEALDPNGGAGTLNPLLIVATVRAASTLVHLAAQGLNVMDEKEEARRNG